MANALARARTPEEFEAAGLPLFPRKIYGELSYDALIVPRNRARLPICPPRHSIGDWVFNYRLHQNQRVLNVTWDRGAGNVGARWIVELMGYADDEANIWSADPGVPFVDYQDTSPGWGDRWEPVRNVHPDAELTGLGA